MNTAQDSKLAVGAILSTPKMITTIGRLAKSKFAHVETRLVFGLDEAIPVGKEMEASGIDVLISRRGTAEILRENLHIPVLALMANPLDILISVKKAARFGKRILITSFRKQISGMNILEGICNVKILHGIYHDSASLEQVIGASRQKGVDVVIGGGVSMKYAKNYGLKGVELYISEEAVAFTIEDALSVARLHRLEQEKSKRYQCIIDSSSDLIISVNRAGVLTTMNKVAMELLRITDFQAEPHALIDYLPESNFKRVFDTKQSLTNKFEKVRGNMYLASHIPITVNEEVAGVVSVLRDTANVIKDEHEVRRNFAKGLVAKYRIEDLIHVSASVDDVVQKAKRYAPSDSTILINGETGTGKEILAQGIHNMGGRSKGPFVSINCAALPDQLLENELFGHEEGAFTGSRRGGKIGLFELAHSGTIFLDEVASMPPNVQASLLRVLQEKTVMRIGSDRLVPINVRVLAASNRNLIEEVRAGRFREDLFFRLAVLVIHMPPLRERMEDLPIIVASTVSRIAKKCGVAPVAIPHPYSQQLMSYAWPGNIRQLENFIERLLLLSDEGFDPLIFEELLQEIQAYAIPEDHAPGRCARPEASAKQPNPEGKSIDEILHEARFCKTKAAQMLGISRTTLWRKMKALS